MATNLTITLKRPHEAQRCFIESKAKRKIICAGRRGGKTTGNAILALQAFLAGRRVLYATPTQEQIDHFWYECKRALVEPIARGVMAKNETMHTIEISGTQNRIRAKTAWDADTLRGDYADLLIMDEWQLMNEEAWDRVGAPMLADSDGDAVFIYTPPSLRSRSRSKARDPLHAMRMFRKAQEDTTGRWGAFHFTSYENPHVSHDALDELAQDMTDLAYRQEIMAENLEEAPGALWKRASIDDNRVLVSPVLRRVVVAVDPATTKRSTSDETGIVVAGVVGQGANEVGYVLADRTLRGTPTEWAREAVFAYYAFNASALVVEDNQGGDMVETTINTVVRDMIEAREVDGTVNVKRVTAGKSKHARAEPVSALYEHRRVSHVGSLPYLEDQMCTWVPNEGNSPDRIDALVWALTELMIKKRVFFA